MKSLNKNGGQSYLDNLSSSRARNFFIECVNNNDVESFSAMVNYAKEKDPHFSSIENISVVLDLKCSEVIKLFFLNLILETDKEFESYVSKYISSMDPVLDIERIKSIYSVLHCRDKPKALDNYFYKRLAFLRKDVEGKIKEFDFFSYRKNVAGRRLPKKASIEKDHLNIVVCIPYLSCDRNSTFFNFWSTRLSSLAATGFEVSVVFSGEHTLYDKTLKNYYYDEKFRDFHDREWLRIVGRKPYYVTVDKDDAAVHGFFHLLDKLAPDILFFMGRHGFKTSGIYSDLCYQAFPIGIFPSQIAQQPVYKFDGAIIGNYEYHRQMKKKHPCEKKSYHVDFPFEVSGSDCKYSGSLGYSEEDFVLVTPLASNRLLTIFKNKLSSDFYEAIDRVFSENANLKWLLVGVDENAYREIVATSEVLKNLDSCGRFKGIKATKELRGLYRCVDAFFAIPGMLGGGGGARLAIYEELPVISPKNSDCSARTSEKLVYSDFEEMICCVQKVIDSTDLIEYEVAECRRVMLDVTPKSSSIQMREASLSIYQAGAARLLKSFT